MKKVVIVVLVIFGICLINSNPFPQFSDAELEFICAEEGI